MFGHEKLTIYPKAIRFVALSYEISDDVERGYSKLLDQLHRAATSIALNIAEGSGKTSDPDRKRFYSIARGSAMECAAVLDILLELQMIREEQRNEGKELLLHVVNVLSKLVVGQQGTRACV